MVGRQYDNLARDYSHNRWVQESQQEKAVQQAAQEQPKADVRAKPCGICGVVLFIIGAAYAGAVWRSFALAECNMQLSQLRSLESQLVNKNNELRIEVEQLKGPDRIIGFAQSKLGMSVARSNIYLKAGNMQNASSAVAVADK